MGASRNPLPLGRGGCQAVWIVYAAGIDYLLLSVLLYLPGVLLFLYSQRQFYGKWQLRTFEKFILVLLILLAIPAIWQQMG